MLSSLANVLKSKSNSKRDELYYNIKKEEFVLEQMGCDPAVGSISKGPKADGSATLVNILYLAAHSPVISSVGSDSPVTKVEIVTGHPSSTY